MNRKRIILIFISLCVFLFLFLIIYAYLGMTGYSVLKDLSSKKFEKVKQEIANKDEINFNDIVTEEWETAIYVNNKNELDTIDNYIQKGIIDKETQYVPTASSMNQLSQIIFLKDGKIVDTMIYDNRYYKIKAKEEPIFYSNDCTFKVRRNIFSTTLKQQ